MMGQDGRTTRRNQAEAEPVCVSRLELSELVSAAAATEGDSCVRGRLTKKQHKERPGPFTSSRRLFRCQGQVCHSFANVITCWGNNTAPPHAPPNESGPTTHKPSKLLRGRAPPIQAGLEWDGREEEVVATIVNDRWGDTPGIPHPLAIREKNHPEDDGPRRTRTPSGRRTTGEWPKKGARHEKRR
uniref:Uncharacterized protein n=1 Tax=Plectus sambesii TaxID=2011161 RepID=A0A914UZM6_9BILA